MDKIKIKTSKITHISRQEMMYRHNKERVIELASITPKIYHELIFNTGCEFVDRLKNENKNRILGTAIYWYWWQHEWKLFESLMLNYIAPKSEGDWRSEMEQMAMDEDVNRSFFLNVYKKIKQEIR